MKFVETRLTGAFLIECDPIEDERGFLAVVWEAEVFKRRGLETSLAQCNISFNHRRGTLRGLHFQEAPFAEVKVVRCTRGVVYDVIVDLRRQSPTFRSWIGVELSADNRRLLCVPEGCAHGFQALSDDAEVYYQVSKRYSPDHARGVRWDDPAFAIEWPLQPTVISARDRAFPDFRLRGKF